MTEANYFWFTHNLIFEIIFHRYVFDLYQNDPIFGNHSITLDNNVFSNEIANFGRLIPERRSITLSCAAWGNWSPPVLPLCLRKKTTKSIILFTINKIKSWICKNQYILTILCIFTAANCTIDPPSPSKNGTDRGWSDWNNQAKSHKTSITYEYVF